MKKRNKNKKFNFIIGSRGNGRIFYSRKLLLKKTGLKLCELIPNLIMKDYFYNEIEQNGFIIFSYKNKFNFVIEILPSHFKKKFINVTDIYNKVKNIIEREFPDVKFNYG